ncbi:hypothetical protein MLD38_039276 [Melastoma candidum]|uniref:Uncharacterized protein n=1 Tax=Melastoma candidum TaxID=119954 RepID=A0ACB9L2M6_9MYRT|nr:hypothetical protein MLD38_039276 [Melastoma candidum]
MACMKLGSKSDAFLQQGQAWFCTTDLPSDVTVEVGEMSFHLHKFPLLFRSGVMERLIAEASDKGHEKCIIYLPDIPGGSKTFELVAKFCYGVKLELTASNVVSLRCASEHLEMTEEYGEGNLVMKTESFLNQVVLRSWKDSLRALQSCNDILSFADQLNITKKCVDSLAMKASTDPSLFGWPVMDCSGPRQSPGGSVLWNGISTGARPRKSSSDWWYEDVSSLKLSLYKRLILAMESRGIRPEVIAGSITSYARKYLPGLARHKAVGELGSHFGKPGGSGTPLTEEEQKTLVEETEKLLPFQKKLVSTKFLFGMLRTAMILGASPSCSSSIEKRIGMQLDQAVLEDLLVPSFSHSADTLYDIDCMHRILEHFLAMDQVTSGRDSPCSVDDGRLIGSPTFTPVALVAKLIDGYLAEVAPDTNLKLSKFQALAAAVPEYGRPLDDGLYRAIDMYLKAHPWLVESEREQLCRLMDCQKLSLEACTHAAQNERLPLRIVVQVLFFEQLQLRTSIAGCFHVSDNLDRSRQLRSGLVGGSDEGGWATAVKENQVLRVGMDSMRMRVSDLEKECSNIRQEIEKLGRSKPSGGWKFGFKLKSQMCSAEEGSVSINRSKVKGDTAKADEKVRDKRDKHKKKPTHRA